MKKASKKTVSTPYLQGKLRFKYAPDRVAALLLLLITSPLFLFLAVLIKLEGFVRLKARGPVFYAESRISQGRVFRILKFRAILVPVIHWTQEEPAKKTMSNERKSRTWFGKVISRWYLDEIPQLINVLRGEMSLVGPQPQLMAYYEKIGQYP